MDYGKRKDETEVAAFASFLEELFDNKDFAVMVAYRVPVVHVVQENELFASFSSAIEQATKHAS